MPDKLVVVSLEMFYGLAADQASRVLHRVLSKLINKGINSTGRAFLIRLKSCDPLQVDAVHKPQDFDLWMPRPAHVITFIIPLITRKNVCDVFSRTHLARGDEFTFPASDGLNSLSAVFGFESPFPSPLLEPLAIEAISMLSTIFGVRNRRRVISEKRKVQE